jgi:hypothetical protein
MRFSQPPVVATWLLKRLARENEALTGDLIEEYRNGRSAAWYWRQVLIAIAVSNTNTIRAHKVLAVRAILLGWTARFLTSYLIARPVFELYSALLRILGIVPYWLAWHYYGYPLLLLTCVYAAFNGWIVARLHRPHQVAMVLAFLASVLLFALPESFRLATDAIGSPRFLPYFYSHSIETSLTAFSILLGGLWGAAPKGAALAESHVKDGKTEGLT